MKIEQVVDTYGVVGGEGKRKLPRRYGRPLANPGLFAVFDFHWAVVTIALMLFALHFQ